MKGKPLTYLLILVVGAIWYQVFMRVKSNLTEETTIAAAQAIGDKQLKSFHRDHFHLDASYRDPFTGNTVQKETSSSDNPAPIVPQLPKVVVKQEIQWPRIAYYGFVRNTKSTVPRALIGVDGEMFKLKTGEEALDNLQVVHIWRDSIQFRYQKKMKTFRKK